MTFALNHMGYFLLTYELLPLIHATDGARIVSTSSGAHNRGNLDLATLATRPGMQSGVNEGMQAYGDSKLCNVLFTRELAKRLNPGQMATCFHPGVVRTGIGGNIGGWMRHLWTAIVFFARTPEKGAQTMVYLASEPAQRLKNGAYYFDRAVARTSRAADDPGLASQLWALSEQLIAQMKSAAG
jgi:NAD(P)-dependent dehydrogenase (short-subunit alcohol dehydrogenase family)